MYKIPMNLQMYAEGGEGPDIADPVSEEPAEVVDFVDPEGDTGEKDPEPAEPGVDENAIYAQARRTAEKQMNAMNARVMSRFGSMTNPETGQPIKTVADYFEALDAQERVNTRHEIEQRGVDPALIDQIINQNPVIQQAQQVLHENSLREGEAELNRQIQQISAFDPTVKSLEDIAKMPTFAAFDSYVRNGLSLPDAYRLANFEALTQRDAAASRQAAINAAKGKSPLSPMGGGADGQTAQLVDIPQEAIEVWKAAYPDLSYKELREKYNRSL